MGRVFTLTRFASSLLTSLTLMSGVSGCKVRGSDAAPNSHPQAPIRIEEVKSFVEQRLRMKASNPTKMFSFDGYCLDYAALWLHELSSSSFKGYLQQTAGVHFFKVDGKHILRSPTHFFIAFNPRTPDEIILDPTYAQFISGAEQYGLDPILIAKTSDIQKVYAQLKGRIRTQLEADDFIGRYDPQEAAELIYSTGAFSKNRTSFE